MKAGRIAWSIVGVLSLCVAGRAGTPPTAKIMVNPVPAKVGPPYPPLIGGGPNIVGNELRLDAGGVRIWVEVQFKDWDPNGDGSPGARIFQVALDGSGLLDADTNGDGSVTDDGDQEDIVLPRIPCDSYPDCAAVFGELLPELCLFSGICAAVYSDKDGIRSDGWCAGGCECGSTADITASGWRVFGCYINDFRPDDGTVRWGATAVYDVPPAAKGKYTVHLDTDETFLADSARPPHRIPILSETGFVINVLTGRCCFGSGTPSPGCIDGVTRAECSNEAPPTVFTAETSCPPVGQNCADACCDLLTGQCDDQLLEGGCEGPHRILTRNVSCDQVECSPDTGACCDHDPFLPCRDNTVLSECQCATCIWHKLQRCKEIDCAASNPIPTVSGWGLAVLTLLLMIGAKIAFARRQRVEVV